MTMTPQDAIAAYDIRAEVEACRQVCERIEDQLRRRSEIARRLLPDAQRRLDMEEAHLALDIAKRHDGTGKPIYTNAETRNHALKIELDSNPYCAETREKIAALQIEQDTLDASIEADRAHARLLRVQAEHSVACLKLLAAD